MSDDLRASRLYRHALGCLLGELIGDAIGSPTEGTDYTAIEAELSRVNDFTGDDTDDITAHRLRHHTAPRMAALGNMPSSSSAMGISPVETVNACQPRAAEAWQGVEAIPPDWRNKALASEMLDQELLAQRLVQTAWAKAERGRGRPVGTRSDTTSGNARAFPADQRRRSLSR